MYYENKSSFYIKQYGPVVLVLVFSIILITSGVYIYMKSSAATKAKQQQVAGVTDTSNLQKTENQNKDSQNNANVDTNKADDKTNTQTPSTVKSDESLKLLEKSSEGTVKSVANAGAISVQIGNDNYDIYLIGIDLSKSPADTMTKVSNDLKDKKVKIVFDVEKQEDSKYYAYLYLEDNTLYNETMLRNGMASLRVEKKNQTLLDILLKAQLDAKAKSVGIWNI